MRKLPVHFMKATLNLRWERGYIVPHNDGVAVIDLKGRKQSPDQVLCLMPTRRDVNAGRSSFVQIAANAGYSVYEIDESGTHPLRVVNPNPA